MSDAVTGSALLGLYAYPDFTLVRGEGTRVWDDAGRAYLDFTAGIAVNALGYASPVIEEAMRAALASGLVHTSNLFRTAPAEALARALVAAAAFPAGVFFCNSGAEATEAALKFARRWADGEDRRDFLAFRGGFHGRLFGSLAVTDRPAYQEPFAPLVPGAHFADVGDLEGVGRVLDGGRIAAVVIEPVQGEGGVVPVDPAFLRGLREACDAAGSLLVFDEVQCGLGRTGHAFAHHAAGVAPDMMTLAKPLAGGLPMGAVLAAPHVGEALGPGDHATTFGGGPLVSTVALEVVRTVTDPVFLEGVRARGARLRAGLDALTARVPAVRAARGVGLMQAIVLDGPAAPVVARARHAGLLLVAAGPDVIRFVPPLTVDETEIDEALALLETALAAADDAIHA